MFRKVHLRLSALCAGITIFILFVMSCGYLYISEKGLKDSSFTSFQNDMNTVLGNLEQQTVITHEWLTRMEDNGKYQIQIMDNDTLFLFNERNSQEQRATFDSAWQQYQEQFLIASTGSSYAASHVEFPFSITGKNYYVCAAVSERKSGKLQVLILMPLTQLERQIHIQRILFFSLNALASFALFFFSWHFTKLLLRPLSENQKKQVQFVASASHELRTPLAVILSCASAIKNADPGEREHFLESIQSEGRRMSRLIEDMLLLTSADNHAWTIQKEPTEMDTLFLETFEAFEPVAAEKSVRLSVELPDSTIPLCLCDRERIRQILAILLHNAVSYTSEDGWIQLSLLFDRKNFRLSVADNGIGIPDSEKKHIFERFYRSDQAHSKKGHFGLGLCIAAEIVKAHRGQIFVQDTPGGGSTFIVELPG
ncbi:MAG: HAMP domain-containing histidine kinase [Lachnospiraceae bacterium]|nr:HAMP domain-containing histidine kinase [Lachnospiraceae bacterium]